MTQVFANIVFSGLLIGVCGVLINMALHFEDAGAVGSSELNSDFFPITVLSFIILSSLLNIGQHLKAKPADAKQEFVDLDLAKLMRVLIAFAFMIVSFFIWEYFGFIAGAGVLTIALSLIMATRSIRIYLFLLLLVPVLFFIFEQGLQITLQ